MRGLFFGIILFSLFGIMFASQTLYNSHQETNKTFDIYNFTENNLVWNYTLGEETIRNNLSEMMGLDYGEIQSKRIRNLIHKFVDFFGYSFFEVSKWVMEFGYTHPEYNFGFFMNLVKYWLFAMIIIAIFPILIPLLALVYLALIGLNRIFKYAKVKLWQRKYLGQRRKYEKMNDEQYWLFRDRELGAVYMSRHSHPDFVAGMSEEEIKSVYDRMRIKFRKGQFDEEEVK